MSGLLHHPSISRKSSIIWAHANYASTASVIADQGSALIIAKEGHVLRDAEQVTLRDAEQVTLREAEQVTPQSVVLHNKFLAERNHFKPPAWSAQIQELDGSLLPSCSRSTWH